MNKVLIVTDSTSDLSQELREKYHIEVLPLHVSYENKGTYDDGINLDAETLYKISDETGELPKTQAIAPYEFLDYFERKLKEGYDIFFTGISSKMSSTYQNAFFAKNELDPDRIQVLDSENLSTGIGLLVLKACKFRDLGLNVKEIKAKVEELVPRVKSQFIIRQLNYLHAGGRCSTLAALFGSMLRLRPMIVVREGSMKVGNKFIGLMKKAVSGMTDMFLTDFSHVDKEFVFVTDSGECENHYEDIMARFEANNITKEVDNIYHTKAGCVISSHCGPGTIGILYIMDEEVK